MSVKVLYALIHTLCAVIWVGGMFFAYMSVRPAAATALDPAQRLKLWTGTFARFFPYVWFCIIALPISGYLLAIDLWIEFAKSPRYVHIMLGLGVLMMLIYLHVFFAPYARLRKAVARQDWTEGGKHLTQIRKLIGVNMSIGLCVIIIASGGRYFII